MKPPITQYIEDPAHLFECVLPPFVHSDVLYRHPKYPFSCDENGVFFLDDPRWNMSPTKLNKFYVSPGVLDNKDPDDEKVPRYTIEEWSAIWGKNTVNRSASVELPTRAYLLYECYHGVLLGNHTRVHRHNFNPYDNRKQNLFVMHGLSKGNKKREAWIKNKRAFYNQSVIEINKRMLAHIAKGRNPLEWYDAMNFSFDLRNEWENNHEKFGLESRVLDHYRNL